MPITRRTLTQEQAAAQLLELQQNKLYTFRRGFNLATNGTNFPKVDGTAGSYQTFTFTPGVTIGIKGINASGAVLNGGVAGLYAVIVSYEPNFSMFTPLADEGNIVYHMFWGGQTLTSAINHHVRYDPENLYVEAQQNLYYHLWADAATIASASLTLYGSIVFETVLTSAR